MIKNILILIGSIFLASFIMPHTANGQCYFAQPDRFDNIWVVSNGDVVCFDKKFKKVGIYSNFMLGNPSTVDALDPFKILVFYPITKSIVILNNKLAEIGKPISLNEKGIADAVLICRTGKGGFWVFDRAKGEIIKFDSDFNKTGEKIIVDIAYSDCIPLYMQEVNGTLYIAYKGAGICRFDFFGTFLGEISEKIDSFFYATDSIVIFQSNGITFHYNLLRNEKTKLDIAVQCIPVFVNGQFYYFDGRTMVVSKI